MKVLHLLISAGLLFSCQDKGPGSEAVSLEGTWQVIWMEGFDREELTITRDESAVSQKFGLRFVRSTDIGEPTTITRTALFVDGALLLDKVYYFAGARYAALGIERIGDEIVLVPYPNPGLELDVAKGPAVFRRRIR